MVFVSYYTSPTNWLDVASRGVRELVADEIFSRELLPEVPSHADGCRRTEGTRGLAGCRVNYSNRHKFPCLLDGEPKIGIVRDHQRGIDVAAHYVQEQVRRHVDVAALLLTVSDRCNEARIADRRPAPVLDHDRPIWSDQARAAILAAGPRVARTSREPRSGRTRCDRHFP